MPPHDPRAGSWRLQANARGRRAQSDEGVPSRWIAWPRWGAAIGRAVGMAAISVAVLGCGVNIPLPNLLRVTQDPRLPPAPLPSYEIGDLYVYSDGHVETVAATRGDLVTWRDARGRRVDRHRDFVLAELPSSEAAPGSRPATAGDDAGLWPLRLGNRSRLAGGGAAPLGEARDGGPWRCAVTRTRTGRFLAGDLDTYRVRCRDSTAKPEARIERIWYHAPALGHPVLRIDKRGAEEIRRELVAVLPGYVNLPRRSRAAARQTLQAALEGLPSGDSEQWRDARSGVAVRATPLSTFRAGNGGYCRGFQKIVDANGRVREYRGIACRGADGLWRPPGISSPA